MKKTLYLVLAASLLVLFGCTKNVTTPTDTTTLPTEQENVPERQTYENKADGFLLQFPGLRTFQEDVYGSAVMFFSPIAEGDTLRENVGIMRKNLERAYSLDDYYALIKEDIIKMIPDFAETLNETITINGIEAKKLIYTGNQGNAKLQQELVYLIQDNAVYIITYTATEATFDEFAQTVDEMIATFEIM